MEEPVADVVLVEPASATADVIDSWGSIGTAKKEKKGKKASTGFDWGSLEDPVPDVPPPPPAAPAPDAETDFFGDTWNAAGSGKKKDKKTKKTGIEEVPPPPPPAPEPAPAADMAGEDWFGGWNKKDAKKAGKVDTLVTDQDYLMPQSIDEPKAGGDDDWASSSWKTGTKAKGSKKDKDKAKGITEVVEPSPIGSVLQPESVQEKSTEEDPWSNWSTGKKTKTKIGRKSLLDPAPPPAPTPPDQGLSDLGENTNGTSALLDLDAPADDPWAFQSKKTSSKDSKTKKGSKVEDTKLAKTTSKSSKESKAADDFFAIVDEETLPVEESKPESPKEEKKPSSKSTSSWGLFGSGSKSTSKSSKEKDKTSADDGKKKAEEDAFAAALGEDPNDILEIIDEAPPKKSSKDKDVKSSKTKGSDKLSKVESKSSKKSDPKDDPIVAFIEEPAADPMFDELDSKSKCDARKADKADSGSGSAAGWGFWGTLRTPISKLGDVR